MPTTEERLAYLEGRVEEQGRGLAELRELVFQLDQKLDRRLDALEAKLDRAIAGLDKRIDGLEQRISQGLNSVDGRFTHLDGRISLLDDRMSRQFLWMLGVQITVLLAVIGALLGR
jgi:uncharacterized coiled-coil protein SlyX